MKTLLLFLLAIANASAAGQSLRFTWDASTSRTNMPISYKLYAHTNDFTFDNRTNATVKVNAGTNLTVAVTDITPGTWTFKVSAYNTTNLIESDLSLPLVATLPVYPAANLRLIVEAIPTINLTTNWTDVGFFKLRVEKP